jgi:hypothetical protein
MHTTLLVAASPDPDQEHRRSSLKESCSVNLFALMDTLAILLFVGVLRFNKLLTTEIELSI